MVYLHCSIKQLFPLFTACGVFTLSVSNNCSHCSQLVVYLYCKYQTIVSIVHSLWCIYTVSIKQLFPLFTACGVFTLSVSNNCSHCSQLVVYLHCKYQTIVSIVHSLWCIVQLFSSSTIVSIVHSLWCIYTVSNNCFHCSQLVVYLHCKYQTIVPIVHSLWCIYTVSIKQLFPLFTACGVFTL